MWLQDITIILVSKYIYGRRKSPRAALLGQQRRYARMYNRTALPQSHDFVKVSPVEGFHDASLNIEV